MRFNLSIIFGWNTVRISNRKWGRRIRFSLNASCIFCPVSSSYTFIYWQTLRRSHPRCCCLHHHHHRCRPLTPVPQLPSAHCLSILSILGCLSHPARAIYASHYVLLAFYMKSPGMGVARAIKVQVYIIERDLVERTVVNGEELKRHTMDVYNIEHTAQDPSPCCLSVRPSLGCYTSLASFMLEQSFGYDGSFHYYFIVIVIIFSIIPFRL